MTQNNWPHKIYHSIKNTQSDPKDLFWHKNIHFDTKQLDLTQNIQFDQKKLKTKKSFFHFIRLPRQFTTILTSAIWTIKTHPISKFDPQISIFDQITAGSAYTGPTIDLLALQRSEIEILITTLEIIFNS